MREIKFTPGPWEARGQVNNDGNIWIDCNAFANKGKGKCLGGTLAIALKNGTGKGNMKANANLIASAPEMYKALSEILTLVALIDVPLDKNILSIITICERAIVKADGGEWNE